MADTVDDFIRELQRISKDKRKLPMRIKCPNGLMVYPSIKLAFKDDIMFVKGSKVEKMVITP